MEDNFLAKFNLPEIELIPIPRVDCPKPDNVSSCREKNNECLKINETKSPKLQKAVELLESDISKLDHVSSGQTKTTKQVKQNLNLGNGLEKEGKRIILTKHFGHNSITKESHPVTKDSLKNFINRNTNQKCLAIKSVSLKSFKGLVNKSVCIVTSSASASNSQPKDNGNVKKSDTVIRVLKSDSQRSILKPKSNFYSPSKDDVKSVSEKDKTKEDGTNLSTEPVCIISEVIGNAVSEFSGAGEPQENVKELQTQLITPKKTNDITKIKGWRRKQFFVEKPTTVEFYSLEDEEKSGAIDDGGNVENAFVCESLDEFLDQEAELKIGYEIPHLFAEFGIKLTKDEVVSKPNLSDKDFKDIETRYCVPVPLPTNDVFSSDDESYKSIKRRSEEDIKPAKFIKLEVNKKPKFKVRIPQDIVKNEPKDFPKINDPNISSNKRFKKFKIVSKVIALVVYPGAFKPLHPIVQYHLNKIRSYRTTVDKNWANFAASAFVSDKQPCKRSVLPVSCCVKIETNPTIDIVRKNNSDSGDSTKVSTKVEPGDERENKINEKQSVEVKKCSVVIKKLKSTINRSPWCLEHNCYNCEECGLNSSNSDHSISKISENNTKSGGEESDNTVIVSPRASFDKNIANLLAKKVRLLKFNGDTLKSIDCLKSATLDSVEFIKLKFVKESFLSEYISIWFLKPDTPMMRSRAFLTFSKNPPMPNAINLKSSAYCAKSLPKIIKEIVSPDNNFYSNEYAILHCDGKVWEIHGSLNIAFGKCNKSVEQIFTSVELPELKQLQEVALNILHVKAVKWWVLDLAQKFKLIEFQTGNVGSFVSRKKFIDTIKVNMFGFLPLKTDKNRRVLGAYIDRRLLPFILIGPYYLLERHNMVLKTDSSTTAFMYYGEENITSNSPLKTFINSVIKNLESTDKRLEGLWLYDKMCLDNTCYLEVVTTDLEDPVPNRYSCIEIEHGYSLSSLTNFPFAGAACGIVKRKDGKEEFKNVTVYLYFNIFDLGYVEGELQFDNSVIINHPLNNHTKMKSHRIGDWFIGIIKRRIQFFPKNLPIKWLITKHKDDLRSRQPFNRFFLSGAHILTQHGVHYLLELTAAKIEKLGLDKEEIAKVIDESEALREIRELKHLADLLVPNSNKSLTMAEVLTEAVSEIKKLKFLRKLFASKKFVAEKHKLRLANILIRKINFYQMPISAKMLMLRRLELSFNSKNQELNELFEKKLKKFNIGRKYLKCKRKFYESLEKKKLENNEPEKPKVNLNKKVKKRISKKLQILTSISNPEGKPVTDPETTVADVAHIVVENKINPQNGPELYLEPEILTFSTNELTPDESMCPEALEEIEISDEKEEKSEIITQSKALIKTDGFLKLTSPELPKNIKLTGIIKN